MGVNVSARQLSIDDFGTGCSSLEYLQRFPVDRLKIDRSFVSGLGGSRSQNSAILRAVVAMGRELGIRTVAEGVENDQQLEIVRSVGCDYGQGHHFSPPLHPQRSEEVVRDIAESRRADAGS
jgi:EAL domain-containing protein (putative c-di-GMP-specific phosphodiesterase class I)